MSVKQISMIRQLSDILLVILFLKVFYPHTVSDLDLLDPVLIRKIPLYNWISMSVWELVFSIDVNVSYGGVVTM